MEVFTVSSWFTTVIIDTGGNTVSEILVIIGVSLLIKTSIFCGDFILAGDFVPVVFTFREVLVGEIALYFVVLLLGGRPLLQVLSSLRLAIVICFVL